MLDQCPFGLSEFLLDINLVLNYSPTVNFLLSIMIENAGNDDIFRDISVASFIIYVQCYSIHEKINYFV